MRLPFRRRSGWTNTGQSEPAPPTAAEPPKPVAEEPPAPAAEQAPAAQRNGGGPAIDPPASEPTPSRWLPSTSKPSAPTAGNGAPEPERRKAPRWIPSQKDAPNGGSGQKADTGPPAAPPEARAPQSPAPQAAPEAPPAPEPPAPPGPTPVPEPPPVPQPPPVPEPPPTPEPLPEPESPPHPEPPAPAAGPAAVNLLQEEQTDAARVGARAELEDELHAKLDELESRLSAQPEREVGAEIDSLATRVAALQTAFEADRAKTSSTEHAEVERLASALEPLERRVTELEQAPKPSAEPAAAEVTAAVASLGMRLEALEASSQTSEQALQATEQALKARQQERAVDLEAARARNEAARTDHEAIAELRSRLDASPAFPASPQGGTKLAELGQRLDRLEARLAELASSPAPAPTKSGPPAAGGAGDVTELAELRRRFDAFEQRFPQQSKVVPLPLPPRDLKIATRLRVLIVAGLVALIVLLPLTFISRATCREGGRDQTRWSIALPGQDPPSGCQKRESGFELIIPG